MTNQNATDIRFSLLELDDAPIAAAEWDSSPDTTPNVQVIEAPRGFRRTVGHSSLEAVEAAMPEFSATVDKVPLFTGEGLEVPDAFATMRTYPDGRKQVLGTVGARYRVVQDSEAMEVIRPLVDQGIISELDGGSHRGKLWVYGQSALTRDIVPGDAVQAKVMAANSHDGSIPWTIGFPCVRPICQNTLAMALSSKLSKLLKIKHTRNAQDVVNQVKTAVAMFGMEFIEATDKMMHLAKVKCTQETLKEYTGYVFSQWADDEETSETSRESKVYTKVLENFESGQGSQYHRGTLWGAYNAITEYTSHQRSRSDDPNKAFVDLQWGNGAIINKRAFDRALELA